MTGGLRDGVADAMVELMGVAIGRGPRVLVGSLDLTIRPGRPFWIVGPNGAGKSSLLRVIAGIDLPRSGRVRWSGAVRPLYYHSEMGLPGDATTRDWRQLARRLAPPNAELPGLWPPVGRGRLVRRLSTGERKRLLLDVLLRMAGPVLLDEPFEHLSPDAKAVLADRLARRARHHIVIVATNQLVDAAASGGGLRLEAGRGVTVRARTVAER